MGKCIEITMEETPQMQPADMYPPTIINQGSKADILDKIRPDLVIEEIKQRLMGREYSEEKGEWVQNVGLRDIALTEVGASAITNLMFPASTRNVSVSLLKDDEIKKRLLSIVRTAMKMCLDNWQDYGIHSVAQLYFVKEIVYTNTLVALKQSENEGIRRMLMGTMTENRSVQTFSEEKKGGVLGLFRR